eukprot:14331750-Alexandrium_andersonii.AAC.1
MARSGWSCRRPSQLRRIPCHSLLSTFSRLTRRPPKCMPTSRGSMSKGGWEASAGLRPGA